MKKKLENASFIGMIVVGIAALCFFICGLMKTRVSYNIFYEDMVRATIAEMVKPEALN